MRGTHQK